ncbi:MAG: TlpA family protein disulfide reductase [bacterium]
MRWQKVVIWGIVAAVLAILGVAVARERPQWSSPLVGRPAPDFSLALFDGRTMRLSDLRGRVVIINFWASWCTACRQEAPVLEWAWKTYRPRGVVLIGVNIWDRREDALGMMREFGKTYPNGPDSTGRVLQDYGVIGVPETFIIDQRGQIVVKHLGPVTRELLVSQLEPLLGTGIAP